MPLPLQIFLSTLQHSFEGGSGCLSSAIAKGNIPLLREFIHAGVDVNDADVGGSTPLRTAIEHNRIDALSLLLACGAHPNGTAVQDYCPLEAAHTLGNKVAIQLLLCHGATYHAARYHCRGLAQTTSSQRTDALMNNTPDELHDPAEKGWLAEFWNTEVHETSIVACAIFERRYGLLTELLRAGAGANNIERDDISTLGVATRRGDIVAMSLLLAHGASVNGIADQSISPLMLALNAQDSNAVALLLAHGADPQEALSFHARNPGAFTEQLVTLLHRFSKSM
jgi:ankyrin repeat protein